ncbi:receptor-like protein 35 [Argentina anserina]|uniref:receptor-like protein 35 n=1 Tax=Argentina anserina TaxID=57926 RepID=UPI0021762168|nr:receptor-like protein 35 [Potentilla anserina]
MTSLFHHFFLFLTITCVTNLVTEVNINCIEEQQVSLLNFKKSLVYEIKPPSPRLITWNSSTDCCSWLGVTCSINGYVVGLDLSREFVSCNIDNSSSLFQLQYLQSLSVIHLDYNYFNSSVPRSFASFSNLTSLSLSHCNLLGTFPKEIFLIPSLEAIDLSGNLELGGSFPEFPRNRTELSTISLSRCNFSGSLTKSFENLTHLVELDISWNNFNSPISSIHWEALVNLKSLDFSNNHFNGSIPSSIVSLPLLGGLSLSNNNFAGKFPVLSNTSSVSLRNLLLGNNNLEGEIPTSIFNLQGLMNLDLSSNNLSGFPFTILHLASNKFGGLPEFLKNQSTLWQLDLSRNQISGHIPNWIWRLTSLIILNLSFNSIVTLEPLLPNSTSTILTIFTLIDFSFNNLSGSIPKEIGEMKALIVLNLSGNAFTGEIPSSCGNMRSLESLDLSQNRLSGHIPQQLATLNFLSVLNVSNNQLVGKIPTSTQISTFPKISFEGNKGLWGPPLTSDTPVSPPNGSSSNQKPKDEIDWDIISIEVGFTCGFGIAIGSLLFCQRWRKWYYKVMCNILLKIFPQLEQRFGSHRRHVYINTRWRL